ncbi:MAG TPA: HNH endonuclease [Planctomycetota bacterium]|nr:HNH endonuclease [Planctomycetota bacterium]
MPSHAEASEDSRSICERLQQELRHFIPTLRESQSLNTCALYDRGMNRFAHVYHRKVADQARVYFRGDVSNPPNDTTRKVTTQIRPKTEKGYDKEYPFFIVLDTKSDISAVAKVIFDCAYPLSIKKSGTRRSGEIRIPEEIVESANLWEGVRKTIEVNVYERNKSARNRCIKHFGAACFICGFDFERMYGARGKGFIHVHHTKPLSSIKSSYRVDPIADLRPVCPNCHAMIHLTANAATCDEIARLISKANRP